MRKLLKGLPGKVNTLSFPYRWYDCPCWTQLASSIILKKSYLLLNFTKRQFEKWISLSITSLETLIKNLRFDHSKFDRWDMFFYLAFAFRQAVAFKAFTYKTLKSENLLESWNFSSPCIWSNMNCYLSIWRSVLFPTRRIGSLNMKEKYFRKIHKIGLWKLQIETSVLNNYVSPIS